MDGNAARFADAVRRRSGPRPRSGVRLHARLLGRAAGPGRTVGFASPMRLSQVLAGPPRPVVRHHWHPAGATADRWEIRLTLHVPLPPALRAPTRPAVPLGGHPSSQPGHAAARTRVQLPVATPPRLAALVHRAAGDHTRPPDAVPATPPRDTRPEQTGRRRAPDAARTPRPTPMVHRQPAPTVAGPREAALVPAGSAPLPLAARWVDAPTAGRPRPPLTERDLPVVVDRVVREIDRRVIAARERRGLTA